MSSMIDLIRRSAAPSNVMQFAAKGALLVPAAEMAEILVYLALHNKVFGGQARLTLAGWDSGSARDVASNPATPKEVLEYFIDPENLRPVLLPFLLGNQSVTDEQIVRLAGRASRDQVEAMLNSPRVMESQAILKALLANGSLRPNETATIEEKLAQLRGDVSTKPDTPEAVVQTAAGDPAAELQTPQEEAPDEEAELVLSAFFKEHEAEIAAERDGTYQPTSFADESPITAAAEAAKEDTPTVTAVSDGAAHAAAARQALSKKWILSSDEQRGSALQKIAKLDIKGRINLAFKGNKEERSLLVRDGTKIVALAVLESPKITDGEVEKFASQKNVLEAVLRAIPMKRRFMKIYPVVRNLTFNPRTPIDVSLGLMKNLLVQDLRHLAGNKEVSDTVRKLALKMFRQKLDVTKKS